MSIVIRYPHDPVSGAPRPLPAETLWGVAAQVRRQAMAGHRGFKLTAPALAAAAQTVVVNERAISVAWDLEHAVHDAEGRSVLGVCQTDPELMSTALVSINADVVTKRPELALSTVAHELGHVVFDVPSVLGTQARSYRVVTAHAGALLDRAAARSERRANEFMGSLLAPPVPLHLRLLLHAHAERLRTVHAPHRGRPGSRVLAADNPADAVAGVIAALADDFGISEAFVRVRLARYHLVEGGELP
jgi:hypothetical protein